MPRASKPMSIEQVQYREMGNILRGLRHRCEQTIPEIVADVVALGATVTETEDGPLVHLRRGSPVLGVAHMDYVDVPHRWMYRATQDRVYTPRLDDRIGIWLLLDVLPEHGIHLDLLFTDSEERGRTTASSYVPDDDHGYNWMVEFDRRGDSTVLYDYDDDDVWKNTIVKHGFLHDLGSFSDISALTHLGVCGMNVGVGYHHEHSTRCFCELSELAYNLDLFTKFHVAHAATKFPYAPPPPKPWYGGYVTPSHSRDDWFYDWKNDNPAINADADIVYHGNGSPTIETHPFICSVCEEKRCTRHGGICDRCAERGYGLTCGTCGQWTCGTAMDVCDHCERWNNVDAENEDLLDMDFHNALDRDDPADDFQFPDLDVPSDILPDTDSLT